MPPDPLIPKRTTKLIPREMRPFLLECARGFPAVAVVGPRQSGKSSLVRLAFPKHRIAVLESPDVAAAARRDPRRFLASITNESGAILDEVQRVPELLSYLLEIIDQDQTPGRWILTGSESLLLSEKLSQTLAGRVATLELLPMTHRELARFPKRNGARTVTLNDAIFSGGYPAIFARRLDPSLWLDSYLATYVERDVRNVLRLGDLITFQRFLGLCAGRTSQLINAASLAADTGISQPTARSWLSVLEATFIIKLLPAWHGNIRKRLVKAPKLHFVDTGLACYLLGLRSPEQLDTHALRGALFESWAVSEVMKAQSNAGARSQLFHWRDQNGAEVDLVIDHGGGLTALEMKSGMTFQGEWLRGITRFAAALPESTSVQNAVCFGGASSRQRRNRRATSDRISRDGKDFVDDGKISWRDLGLFCAALFAKPKQVTRRRR